MTTVLVGNHSAVFAPDSSKEDIRRFYGDVLGCRARVLTEKVDRFQLGDHHFCFVYDTAAALGEDDALKAVWLELKADEPESLEGRVLAAGARKLEVPDPHLYFQAPGGQVFRIVGIDEDLERYERSESTSPAAPA